MPEYIVRKIESSVPCEADWDLAETALIDVAPWEKDYPEKCLSTAKLLATPGGIIVKLTSFEKDPVRQVFDDWGEIWTDSCLEFFFMPDSRTGVYYNFECNANGFMLVGKGNGRKPRERVTPRDGSRSFFSINTENGDDHWSVVYRIPKDYFGEIYRPKGNFYKCQERIPERMHFMCWSRIETEKPDFHRPEFFGDIRF